MDRGDEWTGVTSGHRGQRLGVFKDDKWTEVVSGQR